MLRALVHGEEDPDKLAELAEGRLRAKIPALKLALTGRVSDHHRFLLKLLLEEVAQFETWIDRVTGRIGQEMPDPFREAVARLVTIPGIDERAAENILAEIAGLDAVSLQPAAGAQGELTALLVAAAYFLDRGEKRTRVLIPDSAHGTNPASAAIAGFDAVSVKSDARGLVDVDDLRAKLDERTAVFMITNPNTLGLFDSSVAQIAEMVHEAGGRMLEFEAHALFS